MHSICMVAAMACLEGRHLYRHRPMMGQYTLRCLCDHAVTSSCTAAGALNLPSGKAEVSCAGRLDTNMGSLLAGKLVGHISHVVIVACQDGEGNLGEGTRTAAHSAAMTGETFRQAGGEQSTRQDKTSQNRRAYLALPC